tara:strand:- start:3819 stop:4562 length:744 start_codon:yes stop_codon:yes gene_type:complete
MKFTKRLKYFSVGFGIGILFVIFLFKDREFKWSWLPGNRVTDFILDHPIKINSDFYTEINLNVNLSTQIFNTLLNGDVDFSNSDTEGPIKKYIIEYNQNTVHIAISFKDSISQIIKLNEMEFSNANEVNINDENLYMDLKNFQTRINKKEIKLSQNFLCELDQLKINKAVFIDSLEFESVKWKLSKAYLKPHPYFILSNKIDGLTYYVLIEESSGKIRLKSIQIKNNKDSDNYLAEELFKIECIKQN